MAERPAGEEIAHKSFCPGGALSTRLHYFVPWDDLGELAGAMGKGKWLLLTGPWQSGKTSLLQEVGYKLQDAGYLVVLCNVTNEMVQAANNPRVPDMEAAKAFFGLMASTIITRSRGVLQNTGFDGMEGVVQLFAQDPGKPIIWLLDEAQLLTEIQRPSIIYTFLSEMRNCKQECRSRNPLGIFNLCSFALCGLPGLRKIIGDVRAVRMLEEGDASLSPLSVECSRVPELLDVQSIENLLREYAADHGVCFRVKVLELPEEEDGDASDGDAVKLFAQSILELTSGHKGLVGVCCDYVQSSLLHAYDKWERVVRNGRLHHHVFESRVYSKMLRRLTTYPSQVKHLLLECIESEGVLEVADHAHQLGDAVSDGVLFHNPGTHKYSLSSGLILSALLQECSFAPHDALPPLSSMLDVIRAAFTHMNPDCFLKPKVLDANMQPSEYIMQWQYGLGLKFVLQAYTVHKYQIYVEAKLRDESGQRRARLDILLESGRAPRHGLELEVGGNGRSIAAHLKKSDYYRRLHDCQEMHYIYLWVGAEDANGAKLMIAAQALRWKKVKCWYVQFSRLESRWTIACYDVEASKWNIELRDCAQHFPRFLFGSDPHGKRKRDETGSVTN